MHDYYTLLRFALGLAPLTAADEEKIGKTDWRCLYDFASKQALTGLFFDGICRLPRAVAPRGAELMRWLQASETIRRRNLVLNRASAAIYRRIGEAGYRCCILKGQGNAVLYANPYSRIPGDVDVWLAVPDRAALRRVAQMLAGDGGEIGEESVNHIEMTVGGIAVELHPTPAILCSPLHNRRLQSWLRDEADVQFGNVITLPDGAGDIAVPTHAFNAVYQLQHLYHHYFFEGIGLRQFVDYVLVMQHVGEAGRAAVVSTIGRLGMKGFAGAVMAVVSEIFGLEDDALLLPPDAHRGRHLMHDILRGGNFGQFDTRFARTAMGHNLQRLQRDLCLLRQYPAEALSEPAFRLWHWAWRRRNLR